VPCSGPAWVKEKHGGKKAFTADEAVVQAAVAQQACCIGSEADGRESSR
jgi:hypothetical protein